MSLEHTTEFKSFASNLPCDALSTNRVLFAQEPSRTKYGFIIFPKKGSNMF